MEAGDREEEARRAKEAGDDDYRKHFLKTRGSLLDPGEISFLINRAAAYLHVGKVVVSPIDIHLVTLLALQLTIELPRFEQYKECVKDCDEAVERGREHNADHKLIAKALSQKASALLELATCADDYLPAIRALQQSLGEHYNGETLTKLYEAEGARMEMEDKERHRETGNEFFKQKKYHEAAIHYTEAMKLSPNDPRGNFCSEEDDLSKFKKTMEQISVLKKEASDERLQRIKSEEMTRTMEECLSAVQKELEQLEVQHNEVNEKLSEAKEHNENLQAQLSISRGQYEGLLSKHDHLLHERDCAVREVGELPFELERATDNFSTSLKIGEGGFGCVFKGILRNMTVAIKVLKPDNLQGQSQFEQEVAILSRVRHPHLVTLLGACSESSTLVYEFLPNGSLEDFLVCADKRQTLLWQIRIRIIAEICSALIFLHKNKPHPVVHGDLKPANILLDVNLVSKLSDFGISRLLIQSSTNNTILYHTMHPAGTPMYIDPEFLTTGELTPQSDVYSFGIVILRLLTGKPPVGIKKLVENALDKGEIESIVDASAGEWPDLHVQQLAYLGLSCMEMNRRYRPDLSGDVWRVVEAMRDGATLPSGSSSRSVPHEICTPSYFICPISQDIMNDPHVAADGFTYEAEAIRGWLDSGHDTSPMTNLRLAHQELVPNRALRSAIQEWLQQQDMTL
ncbi:hypothetical protein PR202_gb17634 [Eleusine coracana subsp. coracana]|uniref:RING-type E3 ubiquitin transferase n=1 Tax=Eleusine coracana subsp. coracana TaxID=191504 RepID=A0AAV5F444_ELECO|nr:hypothetical protein PR202_gb17634 [Eleusine coracana subsp. coracana]